MKKIFVEALIAMLIVMIDCGMATALVTWLLSGGIDVVLTLAVVLVGGVFSLFLSLVYNVCRCKTDKEGRL